jgi:hypothetical protein
MIKLTVLMVKSFIEVFFLTWQNWIIKLF